MTKRRPQDIGRLDGEKPLADWLTANGWPSAERRRGRGIHDAGDITGTPGLCWQMKAGAAGVNATDLEISRWLEQVHDQATRAHADHAILVQRRRGKASPGLWWAWVTLRTLHELVTDDAAPMWLDLAQLPCRIRLDHLVTVLHRRGYGTPKRFHRPADALPCRIGGDGKCHRDEHYREVPA